MPELKNFDASMFMQKAILLAEQGRFTAPPNPWVGCVIVRDGVVVGEGYHAAAGQPHAEVNALKQAGSQAKGATAFVTLEPCSHHGRTGPCVEALIEAGIVRVVAALEDPDPRVRGKGFQKLKEAGIPVDVGIEKEKALKSLLPYLHHRKTGRPYCVLKAAASIDGRIAAVDGSSQWITGAEARQDVHRLRAESQAIIIGSGTAIYDTPQLTIRHPEIKLQRNPLRVVLDAKGLVEAKGPLFDVALAPTLMITSHASREKVKSWEKHGVEVAFVPPACHGQGVDLVSVLELLGKRGIIQVMVEGGGSLHGSFLDDDLIDRFVLYIGSCLLGSRGVPLCVSAGPNTIADAARWNLTDVHRFGQDVRMDYTICKEY